PGVSVCFLRVVIMSMSLEQQQAPVIMVSKEVLCNDLRVALHGKVDEDTLKASVLSMQRASSIHLVSGGIVSAIFYVRLDLSVRGSASKKFEGRAGGVFTPGEATIIGTLFTDNVDMLYANTASFQFNSNPVYLTINFFDGSSNLLGYVHAGSISIVTGIGGGSGQWS
ncbi:hypothetical protein GOP47_0026945, partial [Adiantum capillus-veneris]